MTLAVDPTIRDLNDCGCCEGIAVETPGAVFNRPGLSAIAYRVGTHSRFKASMLARLSAYPALAELRTRADDDFSIALLDAWASVADVLTFYQERIANESYLRTAAERRSLLELARLIGYRLRPGVAAGTHLAFTLETAAGAPSETTIAVGVKVQSLPGPGEQPQTFETVEEITARPGWNALTPQQTQLVYPGFGATQVYLKGVTTNLKPGDALLLVGAEREASAGDEHWDLRIVKSVTPNAAAGYTVVTWGEGLGSVSPFSAPSSAPKVYALRQRAALFGHNAPDPRTLPKDVLANYDLPETDPGDWSFTISGQTVDLDAAYERIVAGGWLVLSNPSYRELYRASTITEASPRKFTLTSKVTRVTLDTAENLDLFDGSSYRDTVVFAQSEELVIAERPLTTAVTGDQIPLSGIVEGLEAGRTLIVSGKPYGDPTGETIAEQVTLKQAITDSARTTLQLLTALTGSFDRATTIINANVAEATHGETISEVLGSGDASRTYQRFPLKQSPLTHISAATATGTASTLAVRVNEVLWQEADYFFGRGSKERVFITATDDDGKTSVQFGDGLAGVRPPTGQENVTATYRKGIGQAGNVKAGQLSLLMTRPLGVKGVANPAAATGGADAQTLPDARRNAPLTVLTLDRVVSLQDYEDFALGFAGIAKALATWTWDGRVRGVFVTVAGPDGAAIPEDSSTYENLLGALQDAGDPYVPVRVATFRPATFQMKARVRIDDDYLTDEVLADVETALRDAFSFDARAFGQPVALSEVMAMMQAVAGVVAIDVNALYRTEASPILRKRLPAAVPQRGADDAMLAAELLTLNAAPLAELGTF
jgi:hypothetical protein